MALFGLAGVAGAVAAPIPALLGMALPAAALLYFLTERPAGQR